MSTFEEKMENLRRASQMARTQMQTIDAQLNGMSNEEIENFIDSNPEVAEFLSVGADSDNSGIVVNYANQPQNQNDTITFQPPWEGNFSARAQQQNNGPVNLFQLGTNTGITIGGYGSSYYQQQRDPRMEKYTIGMKYYNINPYQFYTAQEMVDYYDYLESQRKRQADEQYMWAKISARMTGTQEMYDWANSLKFKPADQIMQEAEEERQKAEEERQRQLEEDHLDVVYDVYDVHGNRLQRCPDFKIINAKTKEVIAEYKHPKDKYGQSYIVKRLVDDRQQQYEINQMYAQIASYNRCIDTISNMFAKQYTDNIAKWQRWTDAGLTREQKWALWEDERVDWKKHEKLLDRALKSASFSRETFNDILKQCCHCDLDYANRSDFFSLSYDFERDLHYKSLISTPEEMQHDEEVHSKLQEEYFIKRKAFLDKVMSGNLGCQMAQDAHYHQTFAKPNIDSLTLEDFQKPENQVMYTKIVTPEIATENRFIPKFTNVPPPNPIPGVNFDSNGNPIPQERTIGVMTVDDDTGQVISQQEFDVGPPSGAQCDDSMTDEELLDLY